MRGKEVRKGSKDQQRAKEERGQSRGQMTDGRQRFRRESPCGSSLRYLKSTSR